MRSYGMSRREFLSLLGTSAAGLAMTSLAACASAAAPTPSEAPPAAEAPAPVAEKVTLRLWSHSNPAFVQANEELIRRWQEQKPEVDIKYEYFPYDEFIQTIQTSMAAKNEADIMEMFGSWVQSYAKGGTVAIAPDDIVTMAQAREHLYDAPLDGYVWEGKLYGLPNEYNLENGGVLVNKRMFQETELKYPPEWESWEELVADARNLVKMEGDVMTVAGFHYVTGDGLGFLFWEGILERGGDYLADDKVHLNLDSPQAEETVQWLVDMAVKDKVVDSFTLCCP